MYCYVPGCPNANSGSNESKKPGPLVQIFFSAPQDETLFKKWQEVLPLSDHTFSRDDKVCEFHFQKSEVILFTETKLPNGNVRRVPASEPVLKSGTVPSIFPKTPSTPRTQGHLPKTSQSELKRPGPKRKASALDEEEKAEESVQRLRGRGRPRKNGGSDEKPTTPQIPDKKRKLAIVEPLATPEDSEESPISKTSPETIGKQNLPSEVEGSSDLSPSMQPTIRLVPLESLLESNVNSKRVVKSTKRYSPDPTPSKGTSKSRKNDRRNTSSPFPTLSGKKNKKRNANEVEDPVSKKLKKLMKDAGYDEEEREEREDLDEICYELEKAANEIYEESKAVKKSDTFVKDGFVIISDLEDSKDSFHDGFNAGELLTIKSDPDEEFEQKDSLEALRADIENSRPISTEFYRRNESITATSISKAQKSDQNQLQQDIEKLRDALTSDDEREDCQGEKGKSEPIVQGREGQEVSSKSESIVQEETQGAKENSESTVQGKDGQEESEKSESIIQGKDEQEENGKSESLGQGKDAQEDCKKDESIVQGKDGQEENEKSEPVVQGKDGPIESKKSESIDQGEDGQEESDKSESVIQDKDSAAESKKSESIDQDKDSAAESKKSESIDQDKDSATESKKSESIDQDKDSAAESKKSESIDQDKDSAAESKKSESIDQVKDGQEESEKTESFVQEKDGPVESKKSESIVQGEDEQGERETLESDVQDNDRQEENDKLGSIVQGKDVEGENEKSESIVQDNSVGSKKSEPIVQGEDEQGESEKVESVQDNDRQGESEKLGSIGEVKDRQEDNEKSQPVVEDKDAQVESKKSEPIAQGEDGQEEKEKAESIVQGEDGQEESEKAESIVQGEDGQEESEKAELIVQGKDFQGENEKSECQDVSESILKEKADSQREVNEESKSVDEEEGDSQREVNEDSESVDEDNPDNNKEDEAMDVDEDVEHPRTSNEPRITKVISLSDSVDESGNDTEEEEVDKNEESPLKGTPENTTYDISSDSEADPTWAPDEEAIQVSDEADTDPGSVQDDEECKEESIEDKNTGKVNKPPTNQKSQKKKNKGKEVSTSAATQLAVPSVNNLLTPEAIEQILKQIKLPLTRPVTLRIAPIVKNADGEVVVDEKSGSATKQGSRKTAPNHELPNSIALTVKDLEVSAKTGTSKAASLNNKTTPSSEKTKSYDGLKGLKMFENLGKIKRVFDLNTFLTDVEDELQFRKFCLLLKESLRIVRDAKNAKTNIGKLCLNVTYKRTKTPEEPSIPEKKTNEIMTTQNSKELNNKRTDEPEELECITVDSSIENHYETSPAEKEAG